MSNPNQIIDQLWEKMKERAEGVVIHSIGDGELEMIKTLDGKQIAMKGKAKYFKNKQKEDDR
jgi:hypothetical protein